MMWEMWDGDGHTELYRHTVNRRCTRNTLMYTVTRSPSSRRNGWFIELPIRRCTQPLPFLAVNARSVRGVP